MPYIARCLPCALLQEDFDMGKKLATGGFGTVYKATLEEDGMAKPVIVKKATEFGEAEVGWGASMKSQLRSAACLVAAR